MLAATEQSLADVLLPAYTYGGVTGHTLFIPSHWSTQHEW